ncbi:hypothetical protein LINPERHAP2_LOCUS11328 [Linum perenne]
MNHSRS